MKTMQTDRFHITNIAYSEIYGTINLLLGALLKLKKRGQNQQKMLSKFLFLYIVYRRQKKVAYPYHLLPAPRLTEYLLMLYYIPIAGTCIP